MILYVISVKDRAADAYGRPAYVPSLGVGIRSFTDEVNRGDRENQMYNHPDDFDLYDLGTFDDSTGLFSLHDIPKVICLGKQVKVREAS